MAPSLEGLFRAHVGDVHRFVRHQLGPGAKEPDVEDLTQKVFIDAGRGLRTFRGDSKASTWLFSIASRVVLSHLESRRRHLALIERLEGQIEERSTSMERRLEQRQELELVWRCLLRIKPKKRMVFVMHRIEGRSGKEIAEILQIEEATVWTRLHHARRELLEQLARHRAREKGW